MKLERPNSKEISAATSKHRQVSFTIIFFTLRVMERLSGQVILFDKAQSHDWHSDHQQGFQI